MFFHSYADTFYVAGTTFSTQGLGTLGAYHPNLTLYDTDPSTSEKTNIFIARFEPLVLSSDNFTTLDIALYPNPNNGQFTLDLNQFNSDHLKMELYSILGVKIFEQKITTLKTEVETQNLTSGIYIVKFLKDNQLIKTEKIMID